MKELITNEGYLKLKKELDYLRITKREELKEQIRFATELGDLRENAEYDAAMQDYQDIETKIYKLEKILDNCRIVDNKMTDKVRIGSIVRVLDEDEVLEYHIVGPSEVDSLNNKISYLSNLGSLLIDAQIGDLINVKCDNFSYSVKILNIK